MTVNHTRLTAVLWYISMTEKDLFPPIKEMLENTGFAVNAEVNSCDVVARKDDLMVIIELKRNLSTTLLAQAVDRQKMCDNVYIAVPKPKNYKPQTFHDTENVLKKLELGLIFVTFSEHFSYAEIVFDPTPFTGTRISKKKRDLLVAEINERKYDTNIGGSTKQKIATAYTEKAVYIACLLEKYGDMSAKQLKELGSDTSKTSSILSNNFYGWFARIDKGIYGLTEKWHNNNYPILTEKYREFINNTTAE